MRTPAGVAGFPGTEPISNDELLALDVDVLIPAAVGGVLTQNNAADVRAKTIVEAANGPTTPEADKILEQRGVLVVPDILANAGGVTVSYFEWVQDRIGMFWPQKEIEERMEHIMVDAFKAVVEMARKWDVSNRIAAYMLGVNRVAEITRMRGIYA